MKSLLLAPLLALITLPAMATKVGVSPTSLRGPATETVQVIHMSNEGTEPVSYQVSVYAWQQVGREERETPTRDVMAYPTMLTVAPGAKPVIRLVKLKAGDGNYRVLIRQLPSKEKVNGIERLTNYDLPLIYETPGAPMTLTAHRNGSELVITNTGNRVVQLTAIGAVGRTPLREGMLAWLLPGGTKGFPIAVPTTIEVKADGTPLTLAVP
jgi:fimbrial chaperone protein